MPTKLIQYFNVNQKKISIIVWFIFICYQYYLSEIICNELIWNSSVIILHCKICYTVKHQTIVKININGYYSLIIKVLQPNCENKILIMHTKMTIKIRLTKNISIASKKHFIVPNCGLSICIKWIITTLYTLDRNSKIFSCLDCTMLNYGTQTVKSFDELLDGLRCQITYTLYNTAYKVCSFT